VSQIRFVPLGALRSASLGMRQRIAQHAREDNRVERNQHPPVQPPRQTARAKDGALHHMRATVYGLHAKLKPGLPWHPHFGTQQDRLTIDHIGDTPEVEWVTDA
jgi:hypothetical protein